MPPKRKLMEVSRPLEAINKGSAQEKSIRLHRLTLDLGLAWQARAAAHVVLFAELAENVEILIYVRAGNSLGFSGCVARTIKKNTRLLRVDVSEFGDIEW
ncbi:hypothetical protein [Pseudonocardia sp. GCM10023141]|uniref:hypothetical protein n=1 Tax=Pseudonocardia sp. GCM10023141 TaxID=3252653 RepID=UPI00360AE774